MKEEFFSIQKAAEWLGVSPTTLRRWEKRGALVPERTHGNQRRYSLSQLQAFKSGAQNRTVQPQENTSINPLTDTAPNDEEILNPIAQIPLQDYLSLSSSKSPAIDNQTNVTHEEQALDTTSEQIAVMQRIQGQKNRSFFKLNVGTITAGLVLACLLLSLLFMPALHLPMSTTPKQPQKGDVLAMSRKGNNLLGEVLFNAPAIFEAKVTINKDFVVNGKSLFTEDIKVNNKNVDLGSGKLTASNVVYGLTAGANITISGDPQNPTISADTAVGVESFQGESGVITLAEGDGIGLDGLTITNTGVLSLGGETGDVELTAGDGIAIDGLTITNDDPGTAQNIFKNIIVDAETIIADSNDDTLTFEAGSGIILTPDPLTKKITITSNASGTLAGLTTNGVMYATSDTNASSTAPGTNGTVLKGVTGGAPVFGSVSLSTDVTDALGIGNGGTGVTTTPTNGQLLIGNGSGYTLGTISAGSGIGIGNGSGTVTVTNNGVLSLAGTANQVSVSGATGSITVSLPQNIHTAATPTFASMTFTSNTNQLVLGSGNTGTITMAALTSGQTYTLPNTSGEICLSSGNCPSMGGGTIDGSGTTNYLAKFTNTNDIGNSLIYDTGQKIGIGTISPQGLFSVSGGSAGTALVILNETGDQNILVGSASGTTRFVFDRSGNLNLVGGGYQISGNTVINATALGSNVVTSSLTSVGTLGSGSIASGFGSIDTGADAISGGDITASGGTGFISSGNDADLTFSGTGNHLISASSGTLQLGIVTLNGAVTGNNQSITGLNSLAASGTITFGAFTSNGGILYTNGSGQLTQVAAGTSTQVLKGGTSPSFGSVALGTDVSGTLPVTNGGTGLNTVTTGDLLYASGSDTLGRRAIGSPGQILTVQGGVPVWADPGGATNYWQRGDGTVAPNIITDDLLLGSAATTSAKFAFTNVGNGTPTASISAGTGNSATFLSGTGFLGTTNAQTLTLGGTSTGNIVLDSGSGLITLADATVLSSNLTVGGITLLNGSFTLGDNGDTGAINTSDWDISTTGDMSGITNISNDGSYTQTGSSQNTFSGNVDAANGLDVTGASLTVGGTNATITTAGVITGTTINATSGIQTGGSTRIDNSGNILNIAGISTSLTPTAANTYALGTAVGNQYSTIYGQTLYQNGNQVCDLGGNCSGLTVTYWNQTNGALAPKNTTVDFLVGGTATSSAKFAVLNVNSGTPTASLAGSTTNNALYLTGDGTLATVNAQTLTLGSATTGQVVANGSAFLVSGLTNCDTIDTDSSGRFVCGSDAGGAGGAGTINVQNNSSPIGTIDTMNFSSLFTVTTSPATTAHVTLANDGLNFTEFADSMTLDAATTVALSTFDLTLGTNSGIGGVIVTPNAGGNAALIVNKQGTNDIFTASAAGATKFTIANNGNISASGSITGLTGVTSSGSIQFTGFTNNGGLLYTNGSGVVSQTSAGGATQCLLGGTTPTWGSCDSASDSYWQMANGTLLTGNSTVDMLIGGTATNSAKFAFTNVNSGTPTASISANTANNNTFLTGTGNLGTTNAQTLTLGGTSTGNIVLDSGSGLISLLDALSVNGLASISTAGAISGTQLDIDSTLRLDGTTLSTVGAGNDLTLDAAGSNILFADGDALNAGGGAAAAYNFFANSGEGPEQAGIDADNDLYIGGSLEVDGTIYQGDNQVCDMSGNCSGLTVTYWNQTNGAIAAKNATVDLLVGGVSTSSAKFAVLNVNSGTPTASLSGATGGAYLTAAGALQTTALQTLSIGGSTTGNITLDSGSGSISLLDATTIAGALNQTGAGQVTLSGNVDATNGLDVTGASLTVNGNAAITTVGAISGTQLDIDNSLRLDGTTLSTIGAGNDLTLDATGNNIVFADSDTFVIGGHTGNVGYNVISDSGGSPISGQVTSDNDLYVQGALEAGALYQGGNQVCDLGGNCSGLTVTYWNQASGAISAKNATVDLLLGGVSTGSAKFAVTGINSGTPTASISANSGANATYLTGAGVLGTTNKQTLTLGSTSTGNVSLAPNGAAGLTVVANGDVGIGTTLPSARLTLADNLSAGARFLDIGDDAFLTDIDTSNTLAIYGIQNNAIASLRLGSNGGTISGYNSNIGIGTTTPTALLDVAGTASVSGALTFRAGASEIQTTENNTLTLGGTTTGNIAFADLSLFNAGATIASGQNLTLAGLTGNNAALFSTATTGVVAAATTSTANLCLVSGASSPSWQSCALGAGTNFWNASNGALYAGNTTMDLLVGGITSSSAKFKVSMSGTQPTASVSGVTSAPALLVDNRGSGDLFAASSAGLSRFVIKQNGNVGIGTTNPASALDVAGTIYSRGPSAGMHLEAQDNSGNFYTLYSSAGELAFYGGLNIRAVMTAGGNFGLGLNNVAPLATLDVRGTSGTTPIATFSGQTSNAGIIVDNTGVGDLFTASKSGATKFTVLNSGNIRMANYNTAGGVFYAQSDGTLQLSSQGSAGQCLVSGGTGTPSWTTCAAGINAWNIANGLLYNGNLTTDFAIGGNTSASAKFKVSISGTQPTASIAGTTAAPALLVDNRGSGDIFTGSSGGIMRFVIKQNGNVGIDNGNPQHKLQVDSGNILVKGTNNFSVLGDRASVYIGDTNNSVSAIANTGLTLSAFFAPDAFTLQNLTGNVGLGTTSPTAKLDIRGNVGTDPIASISGSTTNAGLIVDNRGSGDIFTASSSGLNRFVVAQNGNVGIGTATPDAPLNLIGYAHVVNGSGSPAGFIFENTIGSAFSAYAGSSNPALQYDSNFDFAIKSNTRANVLANTGSGGTDRLLITGSGRVGINNSVPTETLDVIGLSGTLAVASFSGQTQRAAVIVDNNGTGDIFTASKSGATKFTVLNSGNIRMANYNTAGGVFYANSSGDLLLSSQGISGQCLQSNGANAPTWGSCDQASSVNAFTITNGLLYNGNLTTDFAIGGATSASAKFKVSISGTQPTASVSGLTAAPALLVDNRGSGDLFAASSSGLSRFVIKQNGNVGIGTSANAANYTLDVGGTAAINYLTDSARYGINTGGGMAMTRWNSANPYFYFNIIEANSGYIWYNNNGSNEMMRLNTFGGLGLGTSNPLARLDVRGNFATSPVASFSAATTNASLVVDNGGSGDIFTASSSGNTRFTIKQNGNAVLGSNTTAGALQTLNGNTLNLGTGATGNINLGTDAVARIIAAGNTTAGTALQFTSGVTTGNTTSSAFVFSANSVTSGTGLYLASSTLTSGTLANFSSTSNAMTSGGLITADWSPSAPATTSGDLVSINLGANADVTGNIFDVEDNDNSLFSVDESVVTNYLPAQFTAAGDVSIAYDLVFTNQSSTYIKSNAPLYLEAGESFESNDITLRTFNSGYINFETNNTNKMLIDNNGNVNIGTQSASLSPYKLYVSDYNVSTAAAMIENTAGLKANGATGNCTSTIACNTGLIIKMGNPGLTATPGSRDRWVLFMTGNGNVAGKIRGNNTTTGVSYDTGAGDYAEWFRKAIDTETFDLGDIVCQADNGGVTKCTAENNRIIGAISDNPGFIGNSSHEDEENYVLVGLLGHISLKVSTANGEIKGGDPLTYSAQTGVAVKATNKGEILGRAINPYNGTEGEVGKILAYVNPTWYDPAVQLNSSGNISVNGKSLSSQSLQAAFDEVAAHTNDTVTQLEAKVEEQYQEIRKTTTDLSDRIASVEAKLAMQQQAVVIQSDADGLVFEDKIASSAAIAGLKATDASQGGQINTLASQLISLNDRLAFLENNASTSSLFGFTASSAAELGLDTIDASNATISNNLNVLGRAVLSDVGITGTLTTGVLSIRGLDDDGAASITTSVGPLKLQDNGFNGIEMLGGKVTIDTQGNFITTGAITTKKVNIDTTDVAGASLGETILKAGTTKATVTTSALTTKSKIFVQPIDVPVTTAVKKIDADTFEIRIETAKTTDIKLNWWIVN